MRRLTAATGAGLVVAVVAGATPVTAGPQTATAAPSGISAVQHNGAVSLRWSSGASTFTVEQATNKAFSSGVRRYTVHGRSLQFTPYGLVRGQTYWFRVRSKSGSSHSSWSGRVSATEESASQSVRVMTYNILELSNDGKAEGDGIIAPWSKRRPKAVSLIQDASPDLVAIEEGWPFVGADRGPRQVDDLVSHLGGAYGLARTEIPPSEPHYFRTGRYVLYKKSTYAPVGSGDHWSLGDKTYAAYQILRNRKTGAQLLFCAVHLFHGNGSTADQNRASETKQLLSDSTAFAQNHGVPVVYAGDFNSHPGHTVTFDGPGIVMRKHHINDARGTAQVRHAMRYDSANGYQRTPPAWGANVDHIWAPPGVAVKSVKLWLHLKSGKFVGAIPSDHNPLTADLVFPY